MSDKDKSDLLETGADLPAPQAESKEEVIDKLDLEIQSLNKSIENINNGIESAKLEIGIMESRIQQKLLSIKSLSNA